MSEHDPIEAQIVPESQALAVRPEVGKVSILRPAGSLDAIAEAFKEYQAVCERILTKDDYQLYDKKPRKKKSAWRKLATAFNVSTCRVSEDIQRQNGQVVSARFCIRAYTPTRQMEAEGFCEVHEKCCASSKGEKCHKSAWKGHYCCPKDCDGRRHWSHPEHDIIATAQTRATNRAIADLIGCGEVSAEELVDDEASKTEYPHKPEPPKPEPKPTPPKPEPEKVAPKVATAAFLTTMIERLKAAPGQPNRDLVVEYFRKLENPSQLMPDEPLEKLPLRFVPATKEQMNALAEMVARFGNGDRAQAAFPPNWDEAEPTKPMQRKPIKDDEAWRNVIVPIPRKGQKRDEYLKHPDTIGSLFDLRHGSDDESQAARQRLWGFVTNYEPKPWTGKDGKERPPSDTDVKFREALDQFMEYFEKNHPDEKL